MRFGIPLVFGLVVVLVAWGVMREQHKRQQQEAHLDFLASDAHVVVGDVPLVLPFVALPRYGSMGHVFTLNRRRAVESFTHRRDAFRAAASDPENAPVLDALYVRVDTYVRDDFNPGYLKKLCDRLTRMWSRSVCNDPWAPLRQALPEQFYLADNRSFDAFENHWTVGGERESDHLRAMKLRDGEVSIACDRQPSATSRFCTAAIPIDRHMMAVWTVWDSKRETSKRQAARQAKAIVAFARLALGPTEVFPVLEALACDLKRPESALAPRSYRSPCREMSPTLNGRSGQAG